MKKLLLISAILVCFFSCKKEDPAPVQAPPVNTDTTKYYDMGYYDIYVNSNYVFPYLKMERGKTTASLVRIARINENTGSGLMNPDSVLIHYRLNANIADKYKVYTTCSKNPIDSTKNMLDNNKIWNRLVVVFNGDTLYDMSNDVNFTGLRSAGNAFDFNVK